MSTPEKIRSSFKRNARAVAIMPEVTHRTAVTEVRLNEGLRCEISEGDWKIVSDMNEKWGGDSEGPNPGFLGRGALGSCLSMTIAMWASMERIPVDSIHVRVEADYDARGIARPAEFTPGYERVRLFVRIESPAPEANVRWLMRIAEQATAYIDNFRRGIDVRVETEIVASAHGAAA